MDLVQLQQLIEGHFVLFSILIIWTMVWKGVALWKAARLNHRKWFIAILIVNSLGILDLIYIFFIAQPRERE